MSLSFNEYKRKVNACFLGKSIGGTLGMPYEGDKNTHNLTYYDPVPKTMLPNDDIDLQVVWLEAIIEKGLPINRKHLAEAWNDHVGYHFDEYGMALCNIKKKIMPPLCGYLNNRFYAGMGAAIRTEIWASLCPGTPDLAVQFAREDSCVDHYSDGLEASEFLVAIQSYAFVENDMNKLLEKGLSYINPDCRVASAVRDVREWSKTENDIFAIREKILAKYGVLPWKKGIINWSDVTINVSFIVLAWIFGKGDFSNSICYAADLGFDTDCTAGTLGAILGVINPDVIEEKWIKPIGTGVELTHCIVGMHNKHEISDVCEMIENLCLDVQEYYKTGVFEGQKSKCPVVTWSNNAEGVALKTDFAATESLVCVQPLAFSLRYPKSISVIPGQSADFSARIINTASANVKGTVTLSLPQDWRLSCNSFDFELSEGAETEIGFTVTAPVTDSVCCRNILTICFDIGGIKTCAQAGMVLAVPWLLKEVEEEPTEISDNEFEGASVNYATSYIQNIKPGKKFIAAVDFKLWYFQDATDNFVAQGLPLKLWIDGKQILQHKGEFYTPSPHRFDCSATETINGGWHRAVIYADNSECNSDELFFAVANLSGRMWFDQIEWKKATV